MLRSHGLHTLAFLALALLAGAVLGTIGPSVGAIVAAPPVCNAASMTGGYGFMYSGPLFLGEDGLPAAGGSRSDAAAVGVFTVDGRGGMVLSQTANVQGIAVPANGTGTYTVNSDCTGQTTLNYATGQTLHLSIVLSEQGHKLRLMSTDPGTAVTGIADLITGGCSNAAAAGSYAYTFTGFVFPPLRPREDLAAVGVISVDAAGNSTYVDTFSLDGTVSPRQGTGVQAINADCTGSSSITLPEGRTVHTAFVVVDGGDENFIVETDPGFGLLGISVKQ